MRDTTSYDIYLAPRTGKYRIAYKRGFFSAWKHYIKNGKPRDFTSYEKAQSWLATKHGGGYIQLRLVK